MFQPGDFVYLKDSVQIDIGGAAWNYIKSNRTARIVELFTNMGQVNLPEHENLYVVEWADTFDGGWDCWKKCLPGRGQIVTQKHMELNFEDSRDVVTIPNIPVEQQLLDNRYEKQVN